MAYNEIEVVNIHGVDMVTLKAHEAELIRQELDLDWQRLRTALSQYGISAPVSDGELASRAQSYLRTLIRIIARESLEKHSKPDVEVDAKSQEVKLLSSDALSAAQDHLLPGDARVKLEDVKRLQPYQPLVDNLRCLATSPASSIKAFGIEWAGIVAATALDKLEVSDIDTGA